LALLLCGKSLLELGKSPFLPLPLLLCLLFLSIHFDLELLPHEFDLVLVVLGRLRHVLDLNLGSLAS
jgi:hypothetical protein